MKLQALIPFVLLALGTTQVICDGVDVDVDDLFARENDHINIARRSLLRTRALALNHFLNVERALNEFDDIHARTLSKTDILYHNCFTKCMTEGAYAGHDAVCAKKCH